MKAFFALPCLVVVMIALSACLGLRYNLSASMPAGLYRLEDGSPRRGDLAQFVLPPDCPFGVLARERGYLGRPESPYPLLKRVAAVAGDLVEVDAHGVRVNGVSQPDSRILEVDSKGRPNLSVLKSGTVPQDFALLLAPYAKSFDGRYFGFVSLDRLQRVIPLFTFNQEVRHD
jgi:conjugative transfer signal peptidase TraF